MSDFADDLPIYTVAHEWAKETPGTSCYFWMHRMAKAIYSEPPTLALRPDDSWGKWKERSYTVSRGLNWATSWKHGGYESRDIVRIVPPPPPPPEFLPYKPEESRLAKLAQPLTSTEEPPWLKTGFRETINREDFKAWCGSAGYPLPRFWFGELEHLASTPRPTPREIIERERRAGMTGNKPSVMKSIVAAIDAIWTEPDRLTDEEIGELFQKQAIETKDARIKRGRRYRGLAK